MKKIYTIETLKEALKFSAAHVATFADGSIEHLHGHNYQVSARLSGELDPAGMVMDVGVLKQWVRALCDELDERFLVAIDNPLIRVETDEKFVRLSYLEKHYELPREDCVLLPIPNTTMEHLAHFLAERLAERIRVISNSGQEKSNRMIRLRVAVSETPGQSAAWTMDLV